jgi:hypothetical protein
MNKHFKELAIGSSILLYLSYGCNLASPTESNEGIKTAPPVEQEDRGTVLTTSASNSLAWSQATNEIIFVTSDGTIDAIDPITRNCRTIDGETSSYARLSISAEGLYLYYFDNYSCYRASVLGGARSVWIEGVNWMMKETAVFSPDNASMAWCKMNSTETLYDSTYLYDIRTKQMLFLMCGAPLMFSPDGSQLLVHGEHVWGDPSQNAGFYLLDLANRPMHATLLRRENDYLQCAAVPHWDEISLRVLSIPSFLTSSISVVNLTANISESVKIPQSGYGYVWSADGSKFAFWESLFYFGGVPGLPKPDLSTWICSLYVVDLKAGQTYEVVKTRESGRGTIRFSPDGKKIAYVAGSTIYVKEIQ